MAVLTLTGCANDSRPVIEKVHSTGVLKVGTEGIYPPFSFQGPDGRITGYDVEVARAVGAKLGARVEFVQAPWDSLFAGLRARRYDLIANQVAVSPQRAARFDLSVPYTVSGGVIVARADNHAIAVLTDLKGKTTAETSTSNWGKVASGAGARIEAVEGFVQAVALVKAGRVDAVVNDSLAVAAYLKQSGDTGIRVVGQAGSDSHQAMAARKDSGLIAAVNTALAALRTDGTLKRISDKYFGTDVSGN